VNRYGSFEELKRALLALAPDDVLASVELTPALAEDILAHDPVNRDPRKGHVARLHREIEGGHWNPRLSVPMGFLPKGNLADGQHRCLAVISAGRPIIVTMRVVPTTIGMDEGLGRTLADQLKLHALLTDKTERDLAAIVTKAVCRVPNASNREYLAFFDANRDLIMDCVHKPMQWLSEQISSVAAVVKVNMLAVTRAKELLFFHEPAAEVDELLYDVVNAGETAPVGSARHAYARQIWDQLQAAHQKKGSKTKDLLKWTSSALKYKREGVIKNAITARFPGDTRRKKKPAPAKAA
jgi:hypothetical protein